MKSIAVKYLSHTATAATMTTTKIATRIWQRWQGENSDGNGNDKNKSVDDNVHSEGSSGYDCGNNNHG